MTRPEGTVSTFLLERIKQLGIGHIFGVPGDFNLPLMEVIETCPDLKWVGCCNELNAAYAADGYARVKRRPGMLITTFGVGELSALNGIAGARAECVPLVHIVGMSGRPNAVYQTCNHHIQLDEMGGDPDHLRYTQASKPFSVCTEIVTEISQAPIQIDNVIEQVVRHSSPGYLYLPMDMFLKPCDQTRLGTQLDLHLGVDYDETVVDQVAKQIAAALYHAQNPCLVVDMYAERFLTRTQIRQFMEITRMWTFAAALGRGAVDEEHELFLGVYNGEGSAPGIADAISACDLVLTLGPMLSDANYGGFTRFIKPENDVLLHPRFVNIKGAKHDISFIPVFERLIKILDTNRLATPLTRKPVIKPLVQVPCQGVVSQTELVSSINDNLHPYDTLLVDTGTFQSAVHDVRLKHDSEFICQTFYACIGYALPATLGAAIAKRELNAPGRPICVEGDGSAQMTVQELGTMIRHKLNPVILLINNEGYSIERAIYGENSEYNDICPNWKWANLCETLGGTKDTVTSHTVTSQSQLDKLLPGLSKDKMHFVEVVMGKYDYPWRLTHLAERLAQTNSSLFSEYAKTH